MFPKSRIKLAAVAAGLLAAALLWLPAAASASTYGSGPYGTCQYQDGCPASSTGSTGGQTETPPPAEATSDTILLNDFQDYFQAAGHEVAAATVNQTINFDVTVASGSVERHSITVKEIGSDYVILTFMPNSFDVRINVGETHQYDVTGDHKNDIEITLNSITGQTASLSFRAIKTAAAQTSQPVVSRHSSLIWLWIGLIVAGLLCFIILFWRRRRRDKQVKTTSQ